jgi:hypothetical protein
MFFYQEDPVTIEEPAAKGKLETRNSPRDIWQDLMKQHFQPWEHTDESWITINKIIQL